MVANAGTVAFGPLVDSKLVMIVDFCVAIDRLSLLAIVDDWDRIMRVNVRGVMLCYKHAAIQMIKQGRGGRIIGEFLRSVHMPFLSHPYYPQSGASSVAGKRGITLFIRT